MEVRPCAFANAANTPLERSNVRGGPVNAWGKCDRQSGDGWVGWGLKGEWKYAKREVA